MEISLFKFILAISFIIFAIAIFYTKDLEYKVILNLISFIMFSALALQSLNIQLYIYDGTTWQTERIDDYYLPLGITFIFAVISGINTFAILLEMFRQPFQKQSNKNKYSRNNKKDY